MHNNLKYLLVIVIIAFANNVNAQLTDTSFRLSGKIIDKESESPIPGVHLIGSTNNNGVVSDIDGNFYLSVPNKDTLIITSIGYKSTNIIVTDSLILKALQAPLLIPLERSLTQLDEVDVFAFKDEKDFKNAIINLKLPEDESTTLKIPGYYYGVPKPVKATAGSPISYLVNKFGKRGKMERKFQKAKTNDEFRFKIDSKYNKEIVSRVTGLKNEELDEFMGYCTLSDTFVTDAKEYDIIAAITDCYEKFVAKN